MGDCFSLFLVEKLLCFMMFVSLAMVSSLNFTSTSRLDTFGL